MNSKRLAVCLAVALQFAAAVAAENTIPEPQSGSAGMLVTHFDPAQQKLIVVDSAAKRVVVYSVVDGLRVVAVRDLGADLVSKPEAPPKPATVPMPDQDVPGVDVPGIARPAGSRRVASGHSVNSGANVETWSATYVIAGSASDAYQKAVGGTSGWPVREEGFSGGNDNSRGYAQLENGPATLRIDVYDATNRPGFVEVRYELKQSKK